MQAARSERLEIDSSGNLNLVSSGSTLTDLNFTASDLNVYARVEGGKSQSGVGDLRFHTYTGGTEAEAMRIDSFPLHRLLLARTEGAADADNLTMLQIVEIAASPFVLVPPQLVQFIFQTLLPAAVRLTDTSLQPKL